MPLFVVYAPDKPDPDAPARRHAVRPTHLDNAAASIADGTLRVGGAMLSPESLTGGDKKMVGSLMIFAADDIESVRARIHGDIYYTSGVWDPERLVILPFAAATPFP